MPRLLVQLLAILIAIGAIVAIIMMPRATDEAPDDAASAQTAGTSNEQSTPRSDDGRPRVDVSPSSKSVGNSVGNKAPYFELADPQGDTHKLADYIGQVVVLDFWGTWCAPCRRIMPTLQKIHDEYHGRGVNMIGISCNERPGADPAKYMADNNFDYGLLLNGEKISRIYGITGYPTLMVIGVDGEIIYSHRGASENLEQQLSSILDEHLAEHGL